MAAKIPELDDDSRKKEYTAILEIFTRFINSTASDGESWEILEEMMELRSQFAINHAIRGFGMDYEEALEIVRNFDDLSDEEKARREILIAAIDNLVDFSVAEEYQMCMDIAEYYEDHKEDDQDGSTLLEICNTYNYRYAYVENLDIMYAMAIAAELSRVKNEDILTYMTQGDERVRPWHLQYEGYSAPKSQFPRWLIPPIENMCRCYLVYDSPSGSTLDNIQAAKKLEKPDWIDPVFEDSVAFGGKIFSHAHRYFQVKKQHKKRLSDIASTIKSKYLNGDGKR